MPDPHRTRTLDDTTWATDPGQVRLSHGKLKRLRPDLYGLRGWLRRMFSATRERVYIEEQLLYGDSRAAVVVCTAPLLVAAYTDELDCVAMLSFPEALLREHQLAVGARLLTVNTYGRFREYQEDLIPGPNLIDRWTGFHPIVADFVSEDQERIEARKAAISAAEWGHTLELGLAYLAARPGVARDGRPVYASIPASANPAPRYTGR